MNEERVHLEKMAAKTNPLKVKEYLEKTGWHIKKSYYTNMTVFGRDKDSPFEYLEFYLPKDNESPEYAQTILVSSERVAEVEGKSIADIITRLCCPNMDRLEYHVQSKSCEEGMLDIQGIGSLYKSVVSIIKSAAMDIYVPSLYHEQVKGKNVSKAINSVKFGQTKRGSFILNFYIPTDTISDQQTFKGMESNNLRKVMIHAMRSIADTVNAVRDYDIENFIKDNESHKRISSNFFYAVSNSDIWEDTSIDITMDWTPMVDIPPGTPSHVRIKKEDFDEFRKLGNRFSPQDKNEKNQFAGYIIEMRGHEKNGAESYGDVLIEVVTPDGSYKATMFLQREEYLIADQCHLNTKLVTFSGVLKKQGSQRRAVITNISDFRELK